jgi:hypothetical protein
MQSRYILEKLTNRRVTRFWAPARSVVLPNSPLTCCTRTSVTSSSRPDAINSPSSQSSHPTHPRRTCRQPTNTSIPSTATLRQILVPTREPSQELQLPSWYDQLLLRNSLSTPISTTSPPPRVSPALQRATSAIHVSKSRNHNPPSSVSFSAL